MLLSLFFYFGIYLIVNRYYFVKTEIGLGNIKNEAIIRCDRFTGECERFKFYDDDKIRGLKELKEKYNIPDKAK